MLIKTTKEITKISDNDKINLENYLESLSYVDSLYSFLNILKKVVPINSISFEPTFKGKYTCEKFNIASNDSENEMKYFVINSMSAFEDNVKKELEKEFSAICKVIEITGTTAKFLLN